MLFDVFDDSFVSILTEYYFTVILIFNRPAVDEQKVGIEVLGRCDDGSLLYLTPFFHKILNLIIILLCGSV